MQYIQPQCREQMEMTSTEMLIDADNEVRIVDAFVEALDLGKLGFSVAIAKEGRPPFHPKTLLKLYLYGYLNRIRSSRRLERECIRNIEVRWLLGSLCPNYHTIADFRKIHSAQFKAVFKLFVMFLKQEDLLGKTTVGIDGTKFRALNSSKNNYNQRKVERHLAYIEGKAEEYLTELEQMDQQESTDTNKLMSKKQLQDKLKQLKERKINYEQLQRQIEQSDVGQVSTTDADSRALIINKNIVEVSYNTQAVVDDKNSLIVHYEATNRNDAKALYNAATAAKEMLEVESLTALADKGYHNGQQITKCEGENIIPVVAFREQSSVKHLEEEYLVENFKYDPLRDIYTCPQGQILCSNGKWYIKSKEQKNRKNPTAYKAKQYRTSHCQSCPVLMKCTKNKSGRLIERSEHQDAVDRNNYRVRTQKELYQKRQQICEHPFGTIKRAWGYTFTLMKGLQKVNAEMGLIFLCYNLKRVSKLIGIAPLLKKLKKWKPDYKKVGKMIRTSLQQSKSHSISWVKAIEFFSLQWDSKKFSGTVCG